MNDMTSLAVMASLHGEWCKKVFDGIKTVEVRKTRPRLEPPFTLYIYCTRPNKRHQTVSGCMVINTDELFRLPDGTLKHDWSGELMVHPSDTWGPDNFLNGKVIGECVCDRISKYAMVGCTKQDMSYREIRQSEYYMIDFDSLCLSPEDLDRYGNGRVLYGWHLLNPILYDKPMMLSDFQHWVNEGMRCWNSALDRAPQSWCYTLAR